MGEIFAAMAGAPVPTLLIIMGFILIIFSVFVKIKDGTTKIVGRDNKVHWPGLLIGIALFGSGLFYQSIIAVQTPAASTNTPEFATATTVPSAIATQASITAEPVIIGITTFTATPSPTSILTIKEHSCIFASTWQAVWLRAMTVNSNSDSKGCLSLSGIGIMADKFGILQLRKTAKNSPLEAGIYTPIEDKSVIKFNIFIKSFYIINAGTAAVINFAVAPAANPLIDTDSARFKLSVDTTRLKPIIYFVLANIDEANGSKVTTQHYEYAQKYAVQLELTGAIIHVYINGNQMNKDLSMPSGQKVFLIGYNLPPLANADIQITDIQVDDVSK
jgi:hypothetical protein